MLKMFLGKLSSQTAARNFEAFFTSLALLSSLSGCGGSFSMTSSGVSGTVSAGPLDGSPVSVYALNSDGSTGALLAQTTTDRAGNFTLPSLPPQSGPRPR